MKTLKEKFGELSAKIKASGQPARVWFPQYTPASLLSAENWWEALAVCEYALDTKEDEKLTEDFFELIFSAFDCNVEVDLNAEEYEFWWEKVMQVCDRVAEFSGAGWAQKGAQYSEARYGKRDMSYLFPYYEKAADMGWAEAEATVAYWRYMGFYCEQNKEEGERRFAALTSPEAILWGKHYRAFVEEFTGDKAKALQIRNDLLAELPEGERLRAHVYAALGDALDRAEGSVAEEAAYYEKSLEIVPNLYSLKNLATLYFRYPELNKPKELGFELWEKAWHAGVWSAANFLGYNYQEEEWLDMPKAIEWLEKGMLYCESYSAYELALIYLYNDEYKNVERGLMCLNRCVEDNYIQGIEGLANIYFNGELVEEDMNRAKELLEKAIELGSGNAAYRLGWMYERGFLSEQPDYVKALEYYEKAASLNNADGYCRMALYLANGYSGVKDADKSRECYEKAAELGSCFALVELAFLYENGDGVEKNYEKAFELISRAAGQGYPYAMFRSGLYMEKGVLGEVKPEEAFAWYTKAAEADDNDAIFALGRCYKEGIGTAEDWDKALEWFGKGAEKEESRCLTELGLAYENGNGVEENPQKAVEYMMKAAEQDYGYAQFKMGDYYFFGCGPCLEDNKKAMEWYEKAVANEIPMAMLRMGEYYLYDYDSLNESEKAFAYFKKAATGVSETKRLTAEYIPQIDTQPILKLPQYEFDKMRPTLLVVDDEIEMLWFIGEIFSCDFNVVTLQDPERLEQVMNEVYPNVIICDVMMPGMGGIELTRRIKSVKETAHIPIIIVSGRHEMEQQMEALSAGAEMYITKPFSAEYLRITVCQVMERKEILKNYFSSPISSFEKSDGKLTHKESKKFLQSVLKIINDNVTNKDLTPRYIADRLAISPRSLYRKMEEIGEDSPTDLIRKCRLHVAKDLLLTTQKTIDEIVFDSGFSNKVTFFKVFREKYECTPKEFRMKHLKESPFFFLLFSGFRFPGMYS